MDMKKICLPLIIAAALASVLSCGPSSYMLAVDMRKASDSGLDLLGKDVAVMYLDRGDTTTLNSRFTKAFAEGLSLSVSDANNGSENVFVYRLPYEEGTDYACKDSLVSLLMTVNSDAIFLLDPVELPLAVCRGRSGACRVSLHVYDAMNRRDQVFLFSSTAQLNDGVSGSDVRRKALKAGRDFAANFHPNWEREHFTILYYEQNEWIEAANCADRLDWQEAMKHWLKCLDTRNLLRRSSAAYNMATACFMLGDFDLALEWLDSSDKDCKLSISDPLRQRIWKALQTR